MTSNVRKRVATQAWIKVVQNLKAQLDAGTLTWESYWFLTKENWYLYQAAYKGQA